MIKNSGNILLIILAVAGILAASVGGYFWWTSKISTPVTKIVENKSVDETTNWKTYTNSLIKLSFRYPNDWKVYDLTEYRGNIQAELYLDKNNTTPSLLNPRIYVVVNDTSYNELIDLLKNHEGGFISDNLIEKTTLVAGYPAKRFEGILGPTNTESRRVIKVVINKGGKPYSLTGSISDKNLFDQILSTFKFL